MKITVPPRSISALLSTLVITALSSLTAFQSFAASTTATVNFGSDKSVMGSQGRGVCSAVYDNYMTSSGTASALVNAGAQAVRYPGGSYADIFHWQNYTSCGGYLAGGNDFDSFINNVVNPAGAKAIITVNYGSNPTCDGGGSPTAAADWVTYANITRGLGIKYWEIGNEMGGNGYYSDPGWEYDLHYPYDGNRFGQPALSPAAYGQNSLQFINAMKARDGSIKCGIGFDTGNASYNAAALPPVASVVDFVVIHWYPGGTDAQILQSPSQIPGVVSSTRAQISQYVGSRSNQVEICMTEGGSSLTGGAGSIYYSDMVLTWLENGAANVDYQELHSGFLSNANALLGPAWGMKMSSILAGTGDMFVTASSGTTLVSVHAVKKTNGHYAVMLLNKSPNTSYTVTVNVSGATLASSGTRYDCNGSSVSQSTISGIGASSFTITVPGYSLSVVDVAGGGCSPTIVPYVQINGGAVTQTASASVSAGASVLFSPQPTSGGSWSWTGPNGFTSTAREVSFSNVQTSQAGTYVAQYTNPSGCVSVQNFALTVNGSGGIANGTYKIVALHSGKVMEVYGAANRNGSQIDQWGYGGGNHQRWTLTDRGGGQYSIIGVQSGKSLEIKNSSTANGAKVQLGTYSGAANQKFTFTATGGGNYRITPTHATGSCLDVKDTSTADGALVDLWNYGGGNNQQWSLQTP